MTQEQPRGQRTAGKRRPAHAKQAPVRDARHASPTPQHRAPDAAPQSAAPIPAPQPDASPEPVDDGALERSVSSSAMLISVCVIVSRITGFFRTWAMAFALGSTFLASSYQVANNLPNSLYELVVGGMLVTAFLPVYVSVRKKLGQEGANAYASNLLSLTLLFLSIAAVLCILFSAQLIYTQSFLSDQAQMSTSVFFFQFFAIQIVFYGVGAIVSGLLNASRDYLWSSIAPAFNNLIVIVTFLAYAFIAPSNPTLALYIIAIGNPAGVFLQMAIQIPALKRNGVRIRFHIDWHDPALRETLQIGVPAVIVMATSFGITSVQTAVAYHVASNGPTIIAYARLWFTLPYAFLAVPITTSMFTELAEMIAARNMDGFKHGVINGSRQIVFLTIPFALYLIVFAAPLVTMYTVGAFTGDAVAAVAYYLAALAVSLPFYSVNTYLQKTFSALRRMKHFAVINIVCAPDPDCKHSVLRGLCIRQFPVRHGGHRTERMPVLPGLGCHLLCLPAPQLRTSGIEGPRIIERPGSGAGPGGCGRGLRRGLPAAAGVDRRIRGKPGTCPDHGGRRRHRGAGCDVRRGPGTPCAGCAGRSDDHPQGPRPFAPQITTKPLHKNARSDAPGRALCMLDMDAGKPRSAAPPLSGENRTVPALSHLHLCKT